MGNRLSHTVGTFDTFTYKYWFVVEYSTGTKFSTKYSCTSKYCGFALKWGVIFKSISTPPFSLR